MLLNRKSIEFILSMEVEQARAEFETAKRNFHVVTTEIPARLPHPDGVATLVNGDGSFRSVMEAYAVALREFNQFLVDGTVPERLRDMAETSANSVRQA